MRLDVLRPQAFELIVDAHEGWSAVYEGRRLPKPDLIIPRTGSETNYFTLAVLRHFERQGVAMVNGPSAVEAVADKLQTLQILSAAGLPIPKTLLAKFPVDVDLVERELGFPVVVKTLRGTRGEGVLLCSSREQFHDLANLLDGARTGADFIFQQYVKASHGRDVRLLVVHGRVVAAMLRKSTDGGFKSNISLGGVGVALDPPAALVRSGRARCQRIAARCGRHQYPVRRRRLSDLRGELRAGVPGARTSLRHQCAGRDSQRGSRTARVAACAADLMAPPVAGVARNAGDGTFTGCPHPATCD